MVLVVMHLVVRSASAKLRKYYDDGDDDDDYDYDYSIKNKNDKQAAEKNQYQVTTSRQDV
jgi:hypothetical protein